jgi:hypothetical protein
MRATARIPLDQLLSWTDATRGTSEHHRLTPSSCERFAEAIAGPGGPAPIDPDEAPPMLLVSLIPRLVREAFEVSGARVQELTYIERLCFIRPAALDQEVELATTFLAAAEDDEGLFGVRLEVALHLVGDEFPVLVGEVGLTCGNPIATPSGPLPMAERRRRST